MNDRKIRSSANNEVSLVVENGLASNIEKKKASNKKEDSLACSSLKISIFRRGNSWHQSCRIRKKQKKISRKQEGKMYLHLSLIETWYVKKVNIKNTVK